MRPAVPVPKEDFNFEEALSKFDKEKAVEVQPNSVPQAGLQCMEFSSRMLGC